jgi:hypothetical protein
MTATVLYFNLNNAKYSVHKMCILVYFVFTSHCICVQVFVL